MLKKFPKIHVTKNALFFILQAPAYHSFTFNSQFAHGSSLKNCVWDFPFSIPSRFY